MPRRIDPKLYLVTAHIDDDDLDVVANHDALVALAGQYEHGMSPSLDALPGRRPQPPSADGLALRQGGRLARRSAGSAVFVSGRCLQLGQDRVPGVAPRYRRR